jgi:hypothetical protein
MSYENLVGQIFGFLKVISFVGKSTPTKGNPYGRPIFKCQCQCGEISFVLSINLKNGRTKSCGQCDFSTSIRSEARKTHGLSYSNYQYILNGIIERCYNTNHISYSNYGGKGIIVCDRWLNDNKLINFLEDMGERPSNNHTIDRINNNGNYEPNNCRWATKQIQNQNYSQNVLTELDVKFILWEHQINKLKPARVITKFIEYRNQIGNPYLGTSDNLIKVIYRYSWKNISITEYINK